MRRGNFGRTPTPHDGDEMSPYDWVGNQAQMLQEATIHGGSRGMAWQVLSIDKVGDSDDISWTLRLLLPSVFGHEGG